MTERAPLPPLPYSWDNVKDRLQKDFARLLPHLGIHEKSDRQGLVHPLNPNRNDRKPGSFVIWCHGSEAGIWKDFACGDAGDVFDLIQYLAQPRPARKIDAYWWALAFLGLERGTIRTAAEDAEARERRDREARAAQAQAAKIEAARQRALFGLWLGLPPIAGTPAETYLTSARGVPLDRMGHQPGALRWGRHVEWVEPETGEVSEWHNVMVSAMTRDKAVTALHLTFLKPDGSGKADRAKAKLMIGSAKGAAIRLSPGPSGLSPTRAAAKGRTDPLAIGEGIETCLPVAVARPDYRVWAAGSLSLMDGFAWPACASAVVLLRDNDWDNAAAAARFAAVEAHWRREAQGRPVVVAAPPPNVDDFNSWARAVG